MAGKGMAMFPNRAEAATLSGGSWQLPLSNVQTLPLQNVARSADLLLSSTQMAIDLDRARAIRALVFVETNVSTSCRKRIRAYGLDGTMVWETGDPGSDGWEDVYPRERPTAQMQWRETNFWSGRPVAEDLTGSTQSIITILPTLYYASRFTVEFDDGGNADRFLDLGYLYVVGQWQFTVNHRPGQQIGFMARSTSARALGGTLYHSRKRHPRTLRGDWDYLPEAEAMSQLYELQRRAGTDLPIFFCAKPDDLVNRQRLSFLCRQSELPPIVRGTAPGRAGGALVLEEII